MEVNEKDVEPLKVNDPNKPRTTRTRTTKPLPKAEPITLSKEWAHKQSIELVNGVNTILSIFPATKNDKLTEPEAELLSEAITEEAIHSQTIGKILKRSEAITPHFLLIRAITTIMIPRLAERGLIPKPNISLDDLPDHPGSACAYQCPFHNPLYTVDQIPEHEATKCANECLVHRFSNLQ